MNHFEPGSSTGQRSTSGDAHVGAERPFGVAGCLDRAGVSQRKLEMEPRRVQQDICPAVFCSVIIYFPASSGTPKPQRAILVRIAWLQLECAEFVTTYPRVLLYGRGSTPIVPFWGKQHHPF